MPENDDSKQAKRNFALQVARYSEIGFIIPAAILVGWIIGALIDRGLKTTWASSAGIIFGAIVGFVQMIRIALRSAK
jgi:F0F1-type ATP synthase assembly protein I